MDFEEYLRCATRAQDQFFQDKIARSASMASLGPKALQSAARAKEAGGPPDLRELQGSGSRRFLDQPAPQSAKRRESSADKYGQKLQMLNLMGEPDHNRNTSMPTGLANSGVRARERGGPTNQATEPRAPAQPQQNVWTQMSINCIMNCGAFSSDQMLSQLNERIFNLTQSAIIKQATAMAELEHLHNGIHL